MNEENAEKSYGIYDSKPAYREEELEGYIETDKVTRGPLDVPFMLLTLIILTIGVIMVLSASFARAYYVSGNPTKYFARQLIFALAGTGAMFVCSLVSVRTYRKFSMALLYVSIFLLAVVPIIGIEENGAKRWISLGFTTFQPSELVKLGVIMSFSVLICRIGDKKMKRIKYGALPFVAILIVIAVLLALEPHFSALIIIFLIGAVMLFAGGLHWGWFAAGAGLGAVGITVIVSRIRTALAAGGDALSRLGYVSSRLVSWVDPFSDIKGAGWQIIQSLYAIGSGGVMGLGLGQGRQKYLYLPEEHNDFIFSVVCEELGFVGAILILFLFALLIIRGYWLAMHARDKYGALVITGITSLLAVQVFFNVAVVTNLIPCTGISLPFFSYGGTALLLQMAEMGIILSMSREIPLKQRKAPKAPRGKKKTVGE